MSAGQSEDTTVLADAELRAALKLCPPSTKGSVLLLLKMFNRLGGAVTKLSDFARTVDERSRLRNERVDAAEKRLVEIERRLASMETRQAVVEMQRSARP